jgi:hypothetical protein
MPTLTLDANFEGDDQCVLVRKNEGVASGYGFRVVGVIRSSCDIREKSPKQLHQFIIFPD